MIRFISVDLRKKKKRKTRQAPKPKHMDLFIFLLGYLLPALMSLTCIIRFFSFFPTSELWQCHGLNHSFLLRVLFFFIFHSLNVSFSIVLFATTIQTKTTIAESISISMHIHSTEPYVSRLLFAFTYLILCFQIESTFFTSLSFTVAAVVVVFLFCFVSAFPFMSFLQMDFSASLNE